MQISSAPPRPTPLAAVECRAATRALTAFQPLAFSSRGWGARPHAGVLLAAAQPSRSSTPSHESQQHQQHGGKGSDDRALGLRAQPGEADLDLQTPAEGEAGLQAVASYDLLRGESQRGDASRGDPASRKPGGQEDAAGHHRLTPGLSPPHGAPFHAGWKTATSPSLTLTLWGEWTHTRVTMVGVQLSPPITFQLRAGSGPVFLSGHERYEMSDLTWEEEEEEEGEEDEEEEEEEDDEDEDVDISLEEESPVKQGKRLVPQKPTSVAKKKKLEKEQEEVRPRVRDKSPEKKAKAIPRSKKPGFKK
ncbi:nucleoplasmin-2 isoform X4 [Callithrix jacchus]